VNDRAEYPDHLRLVARSREPSDVKKENQAAYPDHHFMDVNFPGRVKNMKLPLSNALAPLFEAIINSFDSLADSPPNRAEIKITIERDTSKNQFAPEVVGLLAPIKSFAIQDTGPGFTAANYSAFITSDTASKASRGGKGVGRLLWLKAFDHAEVCSVYDENGKRYCRTFVFRSSPEGIENHAITEVNHDQKMHTTVRLCDYRPDYQAHVPRYAEVLARRIMEHCLEHFVLGTAPNIIVEDVETTILHHLQDMFKEEVNAKAEIGKFNINGSEFTLHNVRVNASQSAHRIHFCAHKRVVVSETLSSKVIPNLGKNMLDSSTHFL
jgi:hypothetical protein